MAPSTGLNRKRQVPAEDTPAFGAIAERFRRAGDLERAVALCQEGLAKFPNTLSARVTLGWALLDLGRYEEARQALESALKRAPDNLAAIRGLAELHDRAEHTMQVPMDGPGQWPQDSAAVDRLEVDPAGSSTPADVPLKPEPLSLDTLLSGAKKKAKVKDKKGKDQASDEPVDVVMTPAAADAGVVPELIQSASHRAHTPEPAAAVPVTAPATTGEAAGVDLNAILQEMDQALPSTAPVEETGVELSAEGADADIEKALQLAQAAAEQAAADAAATRKAAEEQSAAEAAARKAAEDNAAREAAARRAAEEKAAAEAAARRAAEEKAVAEAAARQAAEEKAAEQAAAARKAAEKAAAEAAARQAADQQAAAEAAAKQAAEQKAAAEAARQAAEERAAVQAAAREAAEKAAAEEKARKAAEEKAAAEAAARQAAEEKAAAEAAARKAAEKAAAEAARQAAEERAAAEKAAAEAARQAAEDRAAAEAAAKQAAAERAAAEAAARRAAEEKAEAEATAKRAAKQAAAEAEARRAAEQRAAQEAKAREAAERSAQEARPGPQINGFGVVNGTASGEAAQPGAVLNLSSPVPVAPPNGSPRRALPELESLLRRVESRRAQLMTKSVA